MTKYEKISVVIAVVALAAAIASPFISFYWLDPQIQALNNRARLEVSEIVEAQEAGPARKVSSDEFINALIQADTYHVQILNVGNTPAREVAVTLRYNEPIPNASVELSPVLRTDLSDKDNYKFITLKQAIAPKDSIKIRMRPAPDEVLVMNEFGDRSNLITKAPLRRLVQAWQVFDWDKPGRKVEIQEKSK